ncbi:nucleotidyltransferase family protein [Catenovulum adriaticum]|uniref:Nucleotidyltransferase domain-containing protein n=1 Tax=Catenovulum adriaticum TaxID=2984846 RepID=A0ABY7AIQ1_9ALTE|nr:nucleotidyltransferase domain-containing protein [Catenovulum sp. TS8]WAJ69389.1 nucleotidyltransferase domain-containing protein [Catenovulum sp. TS8]
MKPSKVIKTNRERIKLVLEQYHVTNPRIFGSVARGTDTEESDIDLLVETTTDTTMMDIGHIKYQLKKLLGVSVDVLTLNSVPKNKSAQLLEESKPL